MNLHQKVPSAEKWCPEKHYGKENYKRWCAGTDDSVAREGRSNRFTIIVTGCVVAVVAAVMLLGASEHADYFAGVRAVAHYHLSLR